MNRSHGNINVALLASLILAAAAAGGWYYYFSELDKYQALEKDSEAVWQELMELLDRIKTKGMAVEINTSGTLKGARSQFPSDDIVKALIQRDIPLTLCSDAHRPENIGYQFDEFITKARKWGLTHLCAYDKRKQRPVRI